MLVLSFDGYDMIFQPSARFLSRFIYLFIQKKKSAKIMNRPSNNNVTKNPISTHLFILTFIFFKNCIVVGKVYMNERKKR